MSHSDSISRLCRNASIGLRNGLSTFALTILLGVSLFVSGANAVWGQEDEEAPPHRLSARYQPSEIPDRVILTISGDPATTQTVTWRTVVSDRPAFVEFGLATHGPIDRSLIQSQRAQSTQLRTSHCFASYHSTRLEGLSPDTQYVYRVGDDDHWSEWNHFRTASDTNDSFRFIYFGDSQNDVRSQWSRVIRQAYQQDPNVNFLLHAGDLVNVAHQDEHWGEWFEAGGWINRMVPSIATPGNHEYYRVTEGEATSKRLTSHWSSTFSFPQNGPAGLEDSAYYFDYQGARLISLNSNEDHERQAAWLDELLTAEPQHWVIVTMHHPIYSSTPERDNASLREAMQPVFDKHHVDLVLQGHDHTYARTELVTAELNVDQGSNSKGRAWHALRGLGQRAKNV